MIAPSGSGRQAPAAETAPLGAAAAGEAGCEVTVILVNYNTADLLKPCLDRLDASLQNIDAQVIIVDNASRDDSVALLRKSYSRYEIVENAVNVGFGRANNQVLDRVRGRYVLLLNTDAFVEDDTVARTIAYMDATPRCGVLGVRLLGRGGEPQPSCRSFPTPWNTFLSRTGLAGFFPGASLVDSDADWDHASVRLCDWVPGCYYLVRREVVASAGLFDSRYFLYCEEVDHCRRVKAAGWEVACYPYTPVVHIGGESAKSETSLTAGRQISALQIESELLYFRKHHGPFGVWSALALTALGDGILALKALLRRRGFGAVAQSWKNTAATFASFFRTGGGRHPTR